MVTETKKLERGDFIDYVPGRVPDKLKDLPTYLQEEFRKMAQLLVTAAFVQANFLQLDAGNDPVTDDLEITGHIGLGSAPPTAEQPIRYEGSEANGAYATFKNSDLTPRQVGIRTINMIGGVERKWLFGGNTAGNFFVTPDGQQNSWFQVWPNGKSEFFGNTGTSTGALHVECKNFDGSQLRTNFGVKDNGVVFAPNLPTSAAGLVAGDIWVDTTAARVLKVV